MTAPANAPGIAKYRHGLPVGGASNELISRLPCNDNDITAAITVIGAVVVTSSLLVIMANGFFHSPIKQTCFI